MNFTRYLNLNVTCNVLPTPCNDCYAVCLRKIFMVLPGHVLNKIKQKFLKLYSILMIFLRSGNILIEYLYRNCFTFLLF